MGNDGSIDQRLTKIEEEAREYFPRVKILEASVNELRVMIAHSATKDDLIGLQGHFDSTINGVLRDAINAVPQHQANTIARSSNKMALVATVAASVAGAAALISAAPMIVHYLALLL